jgi:hypothetical protein
MPLILAVGAAYTYYKNSDTVKNIRKIDPKIKLKGKAAISFHPIERDITILELPITTITSFHGNYLHIVETVQKRIDDIVTVNPWILGWLLPMPDIKILYDPIGQDRPPNYFTVYEPQKNIYTLNDTTSNTESTELFKNTMVLPNNDLIGANEPMWKVSILPDSQRPDEKFSIVVSMSHMIGDAHTYYQIYHMLFNMDNINNKIISLNPIRLPNYLEFINETFGISPSSGIFPGVMIQQQQPQNLRPSAVGSSENSTKEGNIEISKALPSLNDTRSNSTIATTSAINKTDKALSFKCRKEDVTKKVVAKFLQLKEKAKRKVATTKSPGQSQEPDMDTSFDSKSSTGTTSTTSPLESVDTNDSTLQLGMEITKTSNKHVIKMFRINHEWITEQKRYYSESHNSISDISVNSILSAFFFQINQAQVGIVMLNLRNKQLSNYNSNDINNNISNCTITDIDAGNYVQPVIGTNTEFHDPKIIHEAVINIGSCDILQLSTSSNENGALSSQLNIVQRREQEEKEQTTTTTSICTNWINFYRNELTLHETCQMIHHAPMYDRDILQSTLSNNISVMNLFTIQPKKSLSSSSSLSDQCNPTIGAFVICQNNIWLQIEQSGIVLDIL